MKALFCARSPVRPREGLWYVSLKEVPDRHHSPAQRPARAPCGLLCQGQPPCLLLEALPIQP